MAKKLKTKTDEIRKLADDDLAKELEDAYRSYFSLRLQMETRQLINHREPPNVRRLIARLKTIQRQREIAATEGG